MEDRIQQFIEKQELKCIEEIRKNAEMIIEACEKRRAEFRKSIIADLEERQCD